ncbi:Putative flippase GtrA (transmembrane translocase of bactoprenol-linked glucose) [Pedobacter terrae]|uniref:Putative flippase GtrA (Transmembrane translocase of bactoprenol-linked glucose) n=1 Tax=Pedobacter terrae TaxID=405671 RepID=A0A1G7VEH0_9SPHI|nr:GtrA family protein [Pedobacter terrae]SDG58245.1 Putative flippase GtrA (transmembrane translocase of bactoprenol-linked glucose) [Pedobacter terrae]
MLTYLKAQASSLIASATDFGITIIAVNFFGLWYLAASIIGTISGGVVNFYVNRKWVFQSQSRDITWQVFRYILVWAGNLIIVTAGVFTLTHFFNLNYVLAKVLSSVVTGISYNYIMQKQFIFSS